MRSGVRLESDDCQPSNTTDMSSSPGIATRNNSHCDCERLPRLSKDAESGTQPRGDHQALYQLRHGEPSRSGSVQYLVQSSQPREADCREGRGPADPSKSVASIAYCVRRGHFISWK